LNIKEKINNDLKLELQIVEKYDEKSKVDESLESPFNLRPKNQSNQISREN
jgi:hypothetical protein